MHAPPAAIGFDAGSLPTMYRAAGSPAARGIYPALVAAAAEVARTLPAG